MKRQEKYRNHHTFEFDNVNPKGKYTSDCVVRAIANATGKPWADVLRDLTEYGIKYSLMPNDPKLYGRWLTANGWVKMQQPRKADNTKYTGDEFCRMVGAKHSPIVAHLGGNHTVCIKDGKVHDTWDSTDGCIGNYWVKR